MANICTTEYRIVGPTKDLFDLNKRLKRLEQDNSDSSGYGNTWLGNVVKDLGGDPSNIYCRGEWMDRVFYSDDDYISLVTETAWDEARDWRKFIESKYNNSIKIYYLAEEPGVEIYKTNDIDKKFFKVRYILNYCDNIEYFESIELAIEFVENLVGEKVEHRDLEGVYNTLHKKYSNEGDYIIFEEFVVVDD